MYLKLWYDWLTDNHKFYISDTKISYSDTQNLPLNWVAIYKEENK